MPFNFTNHEAYKVNYSNLFKHIMDSELLRDKDLQSIFINKWLEVLKEHDTILLNNLNTPQKIAALKANILKSETDDEIFQQHIIFKDTSVFIHFRITPILHALNHANISTEDIKAIPLNNLIRSDSQFLWHDVDMPYSPTIENPIIIVPYLNGQYNFLVIDGNKRISSAMRQNKKSINSVTLAEEYITDSNFFSSSFDKLFYMFNNEIVNIGNQKHYNNLSDTDLIKLSVLYREK